MLIRFTERLAFNAALVFAVFAIIAFPNSLHANDWSYCISECGPEPSDGGDMWSMWWECMDNCMNNQPYNTCWQATTIPMCLAAKCDPMCSHNPLPLDLNCHCPPQ